MNTVCQKTNFDLRPVLYGLTISIMPPIYKDSTIFYRIYVSNPPYQWWLMVWCHCSKRHTHTHKNGETKQAGGAPAGSRNPINLKKHIHIFCFKTRPIFVFNWLFPLFYFIVYSWLFVVCRRRMIESVLMMITICRKAEITPTQFNVALFDVFPKADWFRPNLEKEKKNI